ncbi:MAG TPA: sigma 54-interacting transcriptional regulator [Symbiobacteriaceae bacterium]|jgi:PAS domain S-box-containing protein
MLPVDSYLERVKPYARLMAAASPVLDWLAAASGLGFTFAVTDPEFCVLGLTSSGGNQPPGVTKGSVWGWESVGPTAASPAMSWNRPWLMRAPEHEWEELRSWATLAAPVDGGNGKPEGLLMAWGPDEAIGPHTLGMVGAGAMSVGVALRSQASAGELQTLLKYQAAIVESISDGLLTVDAEGTVTYMNPAAGRILGLDHRAAIGRNIQQLVGFKPVIMDVLRTGEGYVDREFILRDAGRTFHFIKTAIPIRDESGRITGAVDTFREISRVRQMVNRLTGAQARFTFADFIGQSAAVQDSLALAKVAARSSSNVLIMGESGTGKEVLAQAIHNASPFADGPFVAVNCGAIPRDLIEGELFGADEGAFTGAPKGGRPGKFELANGGTIFLDEIGDMPLDMQVKLLRVLQERRVTRLGGKNEMEIRVRVVAATNHDLLRDVREGNFRRDLYYRLNVLSISIPPLNQRLDDLPLLVQWLLERLSGKLTKRVVGVSPEAMAALSRHNWAGNVRELENVLERAVNVAEGQQITVRDLHLRASAPAPGPALAGNLQTISELAADVVSRTVADCNGNITQAARMLGCSRNTVYAKLKGARTE